MLNSLYHAPIYKSSFLFLSPIFCGFHPPNVLLYDSRTFVQSGPWKWELIRGFYDYISQEMSCWTTWTWSPLFAVRDQIGGKSPLLLFFPFKANGCQEWLEIGNFVTWFINYWRNFEKRWTLNLKKLTLWEVCEKRFICILYTFHVMCRNWKMGQLLNSWLEPQTVLLKLALTKIVFYWTQVWRHLITCATLSS